MRSFILHAAIFVYGFVSFQVDHFHDLIYLRVEVVFLLLKQVAKIPAPSTPIAPRYDLAGCGDGRAVGYVNVS